jgi:omega-6 fatty acid desaturase (delta-12 desaturase)
LARSRIFLEHLLDHADFLCCYFYFGLFFQHNFEGSYAHQTAGWEYLKGALDGSSYLKLPAVFQWFAADIGYHNIHHLSERIPNYNLAACHQENVHLLSQVKILEISNILECSKFILWDANSNSLMSIAAFQQRAQLESIAERQFPAVALVETK